MTDTFTFLLAQYHRRGCGCSQERSDESRDIEWFCLRRVYLGTWINTSEIPLTTGDWVHYTLMWDGSKVRFFVNAGEVGIPISVANATLQGTGGDTNTYLGAHPDGGETLGGLFDDLRIFNQALTMKELQAVFEFADSQLIARYGEEYEYQIESIKGPTEYNATGLPQGLEIDSNTGLIFGKRTKQGLFRSTSGQPIRQARTSNRST